jgi:hypothetical protein
MRMPVNARYRRACIGIFYYGGHVAAHDCSGRNAMTAAAFLEPAPYLGGLFVGEIRCGGGVWYGQFFGH